MYTALIIDDEKMIRDGIAKSVEWRELSITDVKTAGNGAEARTTFISCDPDIVILDIRMPEVSGLDLLKEMKQSKDGIEIIILSGFEDFSYVQQALRCGAFDYLLKTAGLHELTDTIKKAVRKMESSRKEKREMSHLINKLEISLPLLRNQYLNELISSSHFDSSTQAKLEAIDIWFDFEKYSFSVVVSTTDEWIRMHHQAVAQDIADFHLQVAEELRKQTVGSETVFQNEYHEYVLLLSCDRSMTSAACRTALLSRMQDIKMEVFRKTNYTLKFGISDPFRDMSMISRCYAGARNALHYANHGPPSLEWRLPKISEVKSYIDAHFHEDLTLDDIANIAGTHPNYISSLFTKAMGQSVLQYVTSLRIKKAKQLLRQEHYKVYEVGEEVGYRNSYYFSRIFRKHVGCSPAQYRHKMTTAFDDPGSFPS